MSFRGARVVVRHSHNLQSGPPGISSAHLAPQKAVTKFNIIVIILIIIMQE